jgi:hypothetical protein
MILDHDICFLSGGTSTSFPSSCVPDSLADRLRRLCVVGVDLNYRIDLRRENVISSLRSGERNYLLEHDQLLKEMRGKVFIKSNMFVLQLLIMSSPLQITIPSAYERSRRLPSASSELSNHSGSPDPPCAHADIILRCVDSLALPTSTTVEAPSTTRARRNEYRPGAIESSSEAASRKTSKFCTVCPACLFPIFPIPPFSLPFRSHPLTTPPPLSLSSTDKRYEPTVSDHRPISGGFSLKVRKVQPIERDRLLVELEDEWQTQHLPARIAEATSFYASL